MAALIPTSAHGGSSGGGATILGPYAFAYNSAGITTGLLIGPAGSVPAGTTVLRAWMVLTSDLRGDVAPLNVDIAITTDALPGNDVWNMASYTSNGIIVAQGSTAILSEVTETRTLLTATAEVSCRLIMYLTATNPTAGAGSVYAAIV